MQTEKKKAVRITKILARRVLDVVDAGLCSGVGKPEPGQMCVEAAVCYALGQPHGDEPSCVGAAVRAYKIGLNDAAWSSNAARAKGMRRVAIAQLGSNKIDQVKFVQFVALEIVRQILPIALRAAACLANDKHKKTLNEHADKCEAVKDLAAARDAARYASDTASDAARYASDAASDAARYASDAARYASYAASDAASAASDASYAASATRDDTLSKSAEIAVQALKAQKCEGTRWLCLTDAEQP